MCKFAAMKRISQQMSSPAPKPTPKGWFTRTPGHTRVPPPSGAGGGESSRVQGSSRQREFLGRRAPPPTLCVLASPSQASLRAAAHVLLCARPSRSLGIAGVGGWSLCRYCSENSRCGVKPAVLGGSSPCRPSSPALGCGDSP